MHWGQGEALHVCECFRDIILPCCAFERFSKHLLSVFTESNLRRVQNSGFKFFDGHALLISALAEFQSLLVYSLTTQVSVQQSRFE